MLALAVVLLCHPASAKAQTQEPLSFPAFEAAYLDRLHEAAPTLVVERTEDGFRVWDGVDERSERRVFLDQAYRRYQTGQPLDAVLDQMVGFLTSAPDTAFRADRAFVLVRPADFLSVFPSDADTADRPIHAELAGDLILLLAQDHGEHFSYPPRSEVAAAEPDLRQAWDAAFLRTIDSFGPISLEPFDEGVFLLSARWDIASSLLIDNRVWEAEELVSIANPPAVAVYRDALLVADADDRAAIANLRRVLTETAHLPSYQSANVFVWREGQWSVLP